MYRLRLHLFAISVVLLASCGENQIDVTKEAAEYYLVTNHQASSGEWTLLHVDKVAHTKVEIRGTCDYYKWGNHEMVVGPNSCDLIVGQRIEPNPLHNRPGDFVMVWRDSDRVTIQRGSGADQVTNSLRVVSSRLIAQ